MGSGEWAGEGDRNGLEQWRVAALSLELLVFTTATAIGLFLGLFGLFSSALGSISGLTLTSAVGEVVGTRALLRARTVGAAGAVGQRDTAGRARGDGATTAASKVSTGKQVILLLVATEGGEAVLLGKAVCTMREVSQRTH